jgi:hypothetical protein
MDHDLENAKSAKLILSTFKQLLGLKINFNKSELFYLCLGKLSMLNCSDARKLSSVTYLYISVHHWGLTNTKWKYARRAPQEEVK